MPDSPNHSHTHIQEDITTIFVVGFPDDMREREFNNLFTFAEGFEGSVLKIPSSFLFNSSMNMAPCQSSLLTPMNSSGMNTPQDEDSKSEEEQA